MNRWAFLRCPAQTPSPEALAEALMAISSLLSVSPEGIWVEVGRSITLFGGERALVRQARQIAAQLTEAPTVVVAVADQPETARVLALLEHERTTRLVTPGADAEALAPLPLEALGASKKAREYLGRLGVERAGELARLPAAGLRQRLGPEGERLLRLARAEPLEMPERYVPPERPLVRRELEPPLPPGEPVLFVLKGALDELTTRLSGRGLALAELRLSLTFEDGASHDEALLLPRPLKTTAPLLATLQERLLALRPPAGEEADEWPERLVALEVCAERTAAAPRAQLSLQSRRELDLEQMATLLARLTASLGHEQVFAAELVPTYRPEATWRRATPPSEPRPPSRPRKRKPPPAIDVDEPPSPRPVLMLPEPSPLSGELTGGASLRWSDGRGVIRHVWGPERLRSQWWSTPFDRDYFVVDLDDGARIWVYRDRRSAELFLQGIFD